MRGNVLDWQYYGKAEIQELGDLDSEFNMPKSSSISLSSRVFGSNYEKLDWSKSLCKLAFSEIQATWKKKKVSITEAANT